MNREIAEAVKILERDKGKREAEELKEYVQAETRKRLRHKADLKRKERELDAELAACRRWSDRWWWTLSRINIVRRQLIEAAKEFEGGGL